MTKRTLKESDRVAVDLEGETVEGVVTAVPEPPDGLPEGHAEQHRTVIVQLDNGRTLGVPRDWLSAGKDE
jgi:hypothetical protein